MSRSATAIVAAGVAMWLGGCTGTLHSATGSTMSSYASQHMVPYLMTSPDAAYACSVGNALGPFIASFERVSDRPDLPTLVSVMGAGICAEAAAWEADLAYQRALRGGRADEAADAQLLGERHHRAAAARFGAAWKRAEAAFGTLGKGCPELEPEQEIFFLLGIASGLQAVMHDRAARGAAGISMAIPRAVERATKCLNSKRWWGVPDALAAAVWLTVPGALPKGKDAKKTLTTAVAHGDAAAVRLSRALQVQALGASGDAAGAKAAITAHGKVLKTKKAAAKWRLLDAYGAVLTRHAADLIWTSETGHRAPTGDFGSFPEVVKPDADEDDMLEGLGE